MKIIKEGNFGVKENVVRRFECRNCGVYLTRIGVSMKLSNGMRKIRMEMRRS